MKVIVGLGNPGKKYAQTRHNIGYRVVELLAEKINCSISREDFYAQIGYGRIENEKICLMKPITFMNLSGKSVKSIMDYYNLEPRDFLIVLDDVELPLGSLRLRPSGSSGGHKGLQSIIEHCNTDDLPRLRLGIGKPKQEMDLANYVLMPFDDMEKPIVDKMVQHAVSAVECWITEGMDIAMNRFNNKENIN